MIYENSYSQIPIFHGEIPRYTLVLIYPDKLEFSKISLDPPQPPPPSRLTRTLGVRIDAIGFHLVQQGWQVRRPGGPGGPGDGLAGHNGHKNTLNLVFLYR